MMRHSNFWNFSLYSLVLLFIIGACASHQVEYRPDIQYKDWFFLPPNATVVGYNTQKSEPIADGVLRLIGYDSLLVKGSLREFHSSSDYDVKDSIEFSMAKHSNSAEPGPNLQPVVLDSFLLGDSWVFLISKDSVPFRNSSSKIHKNNQPKASKLIQSNQDTNRIYSSAAAPFQFYSQQSAWLKAEEDAIKKIANMSIKHFYHLERTSMDSNDNDYESVYKLEYDLVITGIQVEKRVYDVDRQTVNVFVSCPKNGILSN
jgi:hypothetical protein